ncbi:TPM domain-containing protein [Sphingomonas rubra]|uniref:Putative membrane protein n=1 Tax=Sphingomonas rubra TaxID=634430 RepID=A0A1I5UCU0_9SPHN|nr:TPM domain-containing protein [Sphingomonas rubra]SFP93103.1 putative membrane protein [Sphingomonas rubra]
MRLTAEDHTLVTAAVAAAERGTNGEIVTIVSRSSDAYHDAALHWTILAMLLVPALLAFSPALVHVAFDDGKIAPSTAALLTSMLVMQGVAFILVRAALSYRPWRLALTPRATKARRVRARALALFAAAAEHRTAGRTGVLLYLSMEERRAEIIADAAIHGRVSADVWGEAMAAMIPELRARRPGAGMAAAVARIGAVLAEHFPRTENDVNELPDRLIEL